MKLVGVLLIAGALSAQTQFYRFNIDQDALMGAPDHSWLNHPLTAEDRLFSRDGSFFLVGSDLTPNTADDQRARLFGVNLAFGANFPAGADAARIAKRLRKMGVNLVRLHHMDSQPDRDPNNAGSTLTTGPYPTLNPVAVTRLRGFLDVLKAEGIYANLNLHVGYEFRPAVDGVPAMPAGVAFPTQSKPLHMIWPRMIELQQDYTRQLLDALQLRNDPVLAVIEISNETSLLREWQSSNLDRYLSGEYRELFARQWNAFLGGKYASTDALREAWGATELPGPELLKGVWTLELHDPGKATMQQQGAETVVHVERGGNWIYLKQVGFSIETSRPYLAEVELRADLPNGQSRTINWDIKQDVSPWQTMTSRTINVTNQWQRFSMAVRPTFAMNGIGRFALDVQNVDAPLYVRNASLHQAVRRALDAGESIENANIALVGENDLVTDARLNDYLRFLAERDFFYLDSMRQAVREKISPLVPVAGTQMGYGGLMNLDSHDSLDYQDNHFYVDHYNFPNTSWDSRDWRFRDQSSLGSGMSSFQTMAITRQAGRPYTVSEFNQPWPNTYAAEADPTLAAFASFQDWDGLMHFAYSHGRNWDDGVPNGFNMNGDWTKFAGFAQSAWMFRWGGIQAGRAPVEIPVSAAMRLQATREKRNGGVGSFLTSVLGYDPNLAFVHPVRIVKDGRDPAPELATRKVTPPFVSNTGEMTYDRDGKLFLLHAPRVAGVIGYAGHKQVTAGAIDLELAATARGYVSLLLTALDQQPIAQSKHLFLSNPGHTLRTQPGSNPQRPQEIRKYPGTTDWFTLEPEPNSSKPAGDLNGGQRPVWMEQVEAWVTIRTDAQRLEVYALAGDGSRGSTLPANDVERTAGGFRVHLNADTPWYELLVKE